MLPLSSEAMKQETLTKQKTLTPNILLESFTQSQEIEEDLDLNSRSSTSED